MIVKYHFLSQFFVRLGQYEYIECFILLDNAYN